MLFHDLRTLKEDMFVSFVINFHLHLKILSPIIDLHRKRDGAFNDSCFKPKIVKQLTYSILWCLPVINIVYGYVYLFICHSRNGIFKKEYAFFLSDPIS